MHPPDVVIEIVLAEDAAWPWLRLHGLTLLDEPCSATISTVHVHTVHVLQTIRYLLPTVGAAKVVHSVLTTSGETYFSLFFII